jgi:hypothetical protein
MRALSLSGQIRIALACNPHTRRFTPRTRNPRCSPDHGAGPAGTALKLPKLRAYARMNKPACSTTAEGNPERRAGHRKRTASGRYGAKTGCPELPARQQQQIRRTALRLEHGRYRKAVNRARAERATKGRKAAYAGGLCDFYCS